MIDGLRVCLRGLNSVRQQGYIYIWANLCFVAFSLPLVTMPAAYSALFRVAHNAQTHGHEAELEIFWATFRANIWRTLPWGLVNALFMIMFISNMISYAGDPSPLAHMLQLIWWVTGLLWAALMLYTLPIYFEMEQPDIIGATINALLMTLKNPFFTMTILVILIIIAVISTFLIASWALLTWSAIAAIGTAAVQDRLARHRAIRD